MLSNDAKIRACFTTFLAATAPRSEAVFSTWKLVSASNRKAKIIYFVPYEGSWTSPRGALRYLWVLVKLWDPHRTPRGPPGTPWGSPRGPERVSEDANEIWHVGYQFFQFSALKMNTGSPQLETYESSADRRARRVPKLKTPPGRSSQRITR